MFNNNSQKKKINKNPLIVFTMNSFKKVSKGLILITLFIEIKKRIINYSKTQLETQTRKIYKFCNTNTPRKTQKIIAPLQSLWYINICNTNIR